MNGIHAWSKVARLSLLALILVSFAAGPVAAQEDVPETIHPEAQDAISKIRSPFCPGLMLEVCPTVQAQALRDSIQDLAEDGLSADSLVELVVATHGEQYRALPKAEGTGLLAWVMPPTVLLLGLALVVIVLRRLKGTEPEGGALALTPEEQRLIDDAMAGLEADEE